MAKQNVANKPKKNDTLSRMWKYRYFYIMFLPVLITLILFYYLPMLGVRFAFYKYTPFTPHPIFTGLANMKRLVIEPSFWSAFRNTLEISLINLSLSMICAIVVALMLNEIVNTKLKRTVQTIVYLPFFLSWVVAASVFMLLLSPSNGFVNTLLVQNHIIKTPIYFLAESKWWQPVYFFITRWKETGWNTVIFLATLAGISPELYEAASIDGAGRWKQTLYITLPCIMNTIIIVLILNLAKVLNLFESVLVLQNPKVFDVADVLQTYVYRVSIVANSPDYGYSTAIGLFKSMVACVLVLGCNYVSKRVRGRGIL